MGPAWFQKISPNSEGVEAALISYVCRSVLLLLFSPEHGGRATRGLLQCPPYLIVIISLLL